MPFYADAKPAGATANLVRQEYRETLLSCFLIACRYGDVFASSIQPSPCRVPPQGLPEQRLCDKSSRLDIPARVVKVLCRAPTLQQSREQRKQKRNKGRMPNHYRTPDLIQGKVLAALSWEGGCKTEAVARYAGLDEDIARRTLEDLIKLRMLTIDDRNYWRKKPLD